MALSESCRSTLREDVSINMCNKNVPQGCVRVTVDGCDSRRVVTCILSLFPSYGRFRVALGRVITRSPHREILTRYTCQSAVLGAASCMYLGCQLTTPLPEVLSGSCAIGVHSVRESIKEAILESVPQAVPSHVCIDIILQMIVHC